MAFLFHNVHLVMLLFVTAFLLELCKSKGEYGGSRWSLPWLGSVLSGVGFLDAQ